MSCFVAFHYRSYGTFFLQQNRLHNIHRGFTHYKYYRARKIKIRSSKAFALEFFFGSSDRLGTDLVFLGTGEI